MNAALRFLLCLIPVVTGKYSLPDSATCTASTSSTKATADVLRIVAQNETIDRATPAGLCRTVEITNTNATYLKIDLDDYAPKDPQSIFGEDKRLYFYVFNHDQRPRVDPAIASHSNLGTAELKVNINAAGNITGIVVTKQDVVQGGTPSITFSTPFGGVLATATGTRDTCTGEINFTMTNQGSGYSTGPFFNNDGYTLSLETEYGANIPLTTAPDPAGTATKTGTDGVSRTYDVGRLWQTTSALACTGILYLKITIPGWGTSWMSGTPITRHAGIMALWENTEKQYIQQYEEVDVLNFIGGPTWNVHFDMTSNATGKPLGMEVIPALQVTLTPLGSGNTAVPGCTYDTTRRCQDKSGLISNLTVAPGAFKNIQRWYSSGHWLDLPRPTRGIKSISVSNGGLFDATGNPTMPSCSITVPEANRALHLLVSQAGKFKEKLAGNANSPWITISGAGTPQVDILTDAFDGSAGAWTLKVGKHAVGTNGTGFLWKSFGSGNDNTRFYDVIVRAGGTITGACALDQGSGFTTAARVWIPKVTQSTNPNANSQAQARATAAVGDAGQITSISITNAGTGYDADTVALINSGETQSSRGCQSTNLNNCAAFVSPGVASISISGAGLCVQAVDATTLLVVSVECNSCNSYMLAAPTVAPVFNAGNVTGFTVSDPGYFTTDAADSSRTLKITLNFTAGSTCWTNAGGGLRSLITDNVVWTPGSYTGDTHGHNKGLVKLTSEDSMVEAPIVRLIKRTFAQPTCQFNWKWATGCGLNTTTCGKVEEFPCANKTIDTVTITSPGKGMYAGDSITVDAVGGGATKKANFTITTTIQTGNDAEGSLTFDTTAGSCTGLTLTTPGDGYDCALASFNGATWDPWGRVYKVFQPDGGAGAMKFEEAPIATFDVPDLTWGVRALGTPVFNATSGYVTGITVTRDGSGYTTPKVELTPKYSIKSVSIGYASAGQLGSCLKDDLVVVFTQSCSSGTCGCGAHGKATVNTTTGQVINITIISGGEGYDRSLGDIKMRFYFKSSVNSTGQNLPSPNSVTFSSSGATSGNNPHLVVHDQKISGASWVGNVKDTTWTVWAELKTITTGIGSALSITPVVQKGVASAASFDDYKAATHYQVAAGSFSSVLAFSNSSGIMLYDAGNVVAKVTTYTDGWPSGVELLPMATTGQSSCSSFRYNGALSGIALTVTCNIGGGVSILSSNSYYSSPPVLSSGMSMDLGKVDAYDMAKKGIKTFTFYDTRCLTGYPGMGGKYHSQGYFSFSNNKLGISNGLDSTGFPQGAGKQLFDSATFTGGLSNAIIGYKVKWEIIQMDYEDLTNRNSTVELTQPAVGLPYVYRYFRVRAPGLWRYLWFDVKVESATNSTAHDIKLGSMWGRTVNIEYRQASGESDYASSSGSSPCRDPSSGWNTLSPQHNGRFRVENSGFSASLSALGAKHSPDSLIRVYDVRVRIAVTNPSCNPTSLSPGDKVKANLKSSFEAGSLECSYHGDCRARVGGKHPAEGSPLVKASANGDVNRFTICASTFESYDFATTSGVATNKCFECSQDCDCLAGQYCVNPSWAICQETINGVSRNYICDQDLWKKRGTCQNKNTALFGKPCVSYDYGALTGSNYNFNNLNGNPMTGNVFGADSAHPADGYCGEIAYYNNSYTSVAGMQGKYRAALWTGFCVNHVCRECQLEGLVHTDSTSTHSLSNDKTKHCNTRVCVDGRWRERSGSAAIEGATAKLTTTTNQDLTTAVKDNMATNKDITGAILAFVIVLVITSLVTIILLMRHQNAAIKPN